MKTFRTITNLFLTQKTKPVQKAVTKSIAQYDPSNHTIEEFRAFLKYLSDNKINCTFAEPQNFITKKERLVQGTYKNRIDEFAKSGGNINFYQ